MERENKKYVKRIFFFFLLFIYSCLIYSQQKLTVYPIFTDNMVLQRDIRVPVWGKTAEGEKITVQINGQKKECICKGGKWKVYLDPMKAGGPYKLIIQSSSQKIILKNILVGDVYVCGGQSNMAFNLRSAKSYNKIKNTLKKYSSIRLLRVPPIAADSPSDKLLIIKPYHNKWQVCEDRYAKIFSAVGIFFGIELTKTLHIPIGLIHANLGGTPVECWMPMDVLKSRKEFKSILDRYQRAIKNYPKAYARYQERLKEWKKRFPNMKAYWKAVMEAKKQGKPLPPRKPSPPMGRTHIKRPSGLYYGTISPLQGFPIKGVIWYQGEANAGNYSRAVQYRILFPAMIRAWRRDWGIGDFPFLFVQLAPYKKVRKQPTDSSWAWLREAQTMTLDKVKNTGMACIIDAGEQYDIHPKNKAIVGYRLAQYAKYLVYHMDVVPCGPMYKDMKIKGDKVYIRFKYVGSGLEARDVDLDGYKLSKKELKGFAICGKDRRFYWGKAKIISKDTVMVYSDKVKKPVAVRYGWADFPLCNLYNKEGFPAVPFRTDQFPPLTKKPTSFSSKNSKN